MWLAHFVGQQKLTHIVKQLYCKKKERKLYIKCLAQPSERLPESVPTPLFVAGGDCSLSAKGESQARVGHPVQSHQLPRVGQASCLCQAAAPAGERIGFLAVAGIRLRAQGVTSSGTLPGWEGRSAPQGFLLFTVRASRSPALSADEQ